MCVYVCGCTCSRGYVYNDNRATINQSYILVHAATSPLRKALEHSYLLCITSLVFSYSPGCFQSCRNGGWTTICLVNELTELPILNCRTGTYVPLVTPLPFLATSKHLENLFSHLPLQDTLGKPVGCTPLALPLLFRHSWMCGVSAGLWDSYCSLWPHCQTSMLCSHRQMLFLSVIGRTQWPAGIASFWPRMVPLRAPFEEMYLALSIQLLSEQDIHNHLPLDLGSARQGWGYLLQQCARSAHHGWRQGVGDLCNKGNNFLSSVYSNTTFLLCIW